MKEIEKEKGSFRDPAGKIYYHNNQVFRVLENEGKERFNFIKENNLLKNLIENHFLIDSQEVRNSENEFQDFKDKTIIKHQKIDYISYPYEWSFDQLKEAALFHLDLHIYLLNHNATLIDASAYNIQFISFKPIYIDILSIKKYQDGEFWKAHKQFCENFLNPLILKSKKNINFNNWFKGNLEGITTADLNSILNFRDKFSYNIFTQVVLLNFLEQKAIKNDKINFQKFNRKKFPKNTFIAMLTNLKKFIITLKLKKDKTLWDNYSVTNTYNKDEEAKKKSIVVDFAKKYKFKYLADFGCNDGIYSKLSLENGCENVIGFDFDLNAVNSAYNLAKKEKINFLPLYFDASNPSSNIGWAQQERKGFFERINFTGMLSLAFEHHLAIAKNVPLDEVVNWLIKSAPRGLIEFVPKNDETIKKMLTLKGDIFNNYNEDTFRNLIKRNSEIILETVISKSGRRIFEYSTSK